MVVDVGVVVVVTNVAIASEVHTKPFGFLFVFVVVVVLNCLASHMALDMGLDCWSNDVFLVVSVVVLVNATVVVAVVSESS